MRLCASCAHACVLCWTVPSRSCRKRLPVCWWPQVFGDGSWRYLHTAPAALGHKPCSKKQRTQHQQQQREQQLPKQPQQQLVMQHIGSRVRVQTRAMAAAAAAVQAVVQEVLPARHQDKAAASSAKATKNLQHRRSLPRKRSADASAGNHRQQ